MRKIHYEIDSRWSIISKLKLKSGQRGANTKQQQSIYTITQDVRGIQDGTSTRNERKRAHKNT